MTTAGVLDSLQEKLKIEKENSLSGCLPSNAPLSAGLLSSLPAGGVLKRALSCQNEAIRENALLPFRGQTGNIFCFLSFTLILSPFLAQLCSFGVSNG